MKRALVFGASGAIGQAICQELADCGWSLYLHFNGHEAQVDHQCEKLVSEYPKQDFLPFKLDFLCSNDELERGIRQLLPINTVIFAQGITKFSFFGEQSLNQIDQIMQINLITPVKIVRLLEPKLLKTTHARILFLGSVYGGQGSAMESIYSLTKGALSRFAQSYAREVASNGMTVNVLAPGAVESSMNQIFSEQTMAQVKSEIPAGRLAQPKEISYWVKTLLDPRADYLTGQTIYVDGGWLM